MIFVGVLEIGIVISGVLFGLVTCQVYVYHKNFPNDPLWLKIGLVRASIQALYNSCAADMREMLE